MDEQGLPEISSQDPWEVERVKRSDAKDQLDAELLALYFQLQQDLNKASDLQSTKSKCCSIKATLKESFFNFPILSVNKENANARLQVWHAKTTKKVNKLCEQMERGVSGINHGINFFAFEAIIGHSLAKAFLLYQNWINKNLQ